MFYDQVKESADYIRSKVNAKADYAAILDGTLWNHLAEVDTTCKLH